MNTIYDPLISILNRSNYAAVGYDFYKAVTKPDVVEHLENIPKGLTVYVNPADYSNVYQAVICNVPTFVATKNTITFTLAKDDRTINVRIVKMVERYRSCYDEVDSNLSTACLTSNKLLWLNPVSTLMLMLDSSWSDYNKSAAIILLDSLNDSNAQYVAHLLENLGDIIPNYDVIHEHYTETVNAVLAIKHAREKTAAANAPEKEFAVPGEIVPEFAENDITDNQTLTPSFDAVDIKVSTIAAKAMEFLQRQVRLHLHAKSLVLYECRSAREFVVHFSDNVYGKCETIFRGSSYLQFVKTDGYEKVYQFVFENRLFKVIFTSQYKDSSYERDVLQQVLTKAGIDFYEDGVTNNVTVRQSERDSVVKAFSSLGYCLNPTADDDLFYVEYINRLIENRPSMFFFVTFNQNQ